MQPFSNLDLFSVGVAISAMAILGFLVFWNNPKSTTHRSFLLFSISAILWSSFNYLYYQFSDPVLVIRLLRIHAFFAIWYVFFIFQIFYVFPKTEVKFPWWYKSLLSPFVAIVSILSLTPLIFDKVTKFSEFGRLESVQNGPALPLFGLVVIGLVAAGPFLLLKRRAQAAPAERKQFSFVLAGALLTFALHIIFNFIFPALLDNARYIPLGAVFIFPFIAFTAYAIFKHGLLNVKVIATEILTFVLAIISLFEILLSNNFGELVFRIIVFSLVLIASIFLNRSVRREIEQREELQKLTEELQAANTKLVELSRFKTQLLSLASHQIKSPLAAIKGFISILLEGLYGPISDKVRETLGKMKKSSDELIALIDTLLDLRRVEEGRLEYEFAPVDLNGLVGEVVEGLRPLAAEKKIELNFTAALGALTISADREKLKQVIQNLVDNAIKYTPSGAVKVETASQSGTAIVSVKDSGLGIDKNLIPYLFEEFVRDERVKKSIRGTGLGLYIARRIVEAHKGKIWAESGGEGKGSSFYIALQIFK